MRVGGLWIGESHTNVVGKEDTLTDTIAPTFWALGLEEGAPILFLALFGAIDGQLAVGALLRGEGRCDVLLQMVLQRRLVTAFDKKKCCSQTCL
jgi:hypothetical protein